MCVCLCMCVCVCVCVCVCERERARARDLVARHGQGCQPGQLQHLTSRGFMSAGPYVRLIDFVSLNPRLTGFQGLSIKSNKEKGNEA